MVKAVTKKTVNKVASKQIYTATASIMCKNYTAKGKTILEAIRNVAVENIKGKCILTIEHGDAKKERILQPNMSFRLFSSSRLMKEIASKQVSILFDL